LSVNLGLKAGGQHYVGSITGLAFETSTENNWGCATSRAFRESLPWGLARPFTHCRVCSKVCSKMSRARAVPRSGARP
jgi:hypothetical protein